jgi:hypothetical protein
MIELTDQQRQAAAHGTPVLLTVDGRDVVLLRCDIFRRIQAVLETERSLIEAGAIRAPAKASELIRSEPLPADSGLSDVVLIDAARYDEIRELVEDDRLRSAWVGAVGAAQRSWAQDNPC